MATYYTCPANAKIMPIGKGQFDQIFTLINPVKRSINIFLIIFLLLPLSNLFSQGSLVINGVPNPALRGRTYTVTYLLTPSANSSRNWTLLANCTGCSSISIITSNPQPTGPSIATASWQVSFTASSNEAQPNVILGGTANPDMGASISVSPAVTTPPPHRAPLLQRQARGRVHPVALAHGQRKG